MSRDKRPIFIVRSLPVSVAVPEVDVEAFTFRTSTATAEGWVVQVETETPSLGSQYEMSGGEGRVVVCLESPGVENYSDAKEVIRFSCEGSTLRHLAAALLAAANESESVEQDARRRG